MQSQIHKTSNWLWSTWVQSCPFKQVNSVLYCFVCLYVAFVASVYYTVMEPCLLRSFSNLFIVIECYPGPARGRSILMVRQGSGCNLGATND